MLNEIYSIGKRVIFVTCNFRGVKRLSINKLKNYIFGYKIEKLQNMRKVLQKEESIENSVIRLTKKAGGIAKKYLPYNDNGMPDRLIILPDIPMFFVETKRPGLDLEPLQAAVHEQLKALGVEVYKVDNVEQFKKILYDKQTAGSTEI